MTQSVMTGIAVRPSTFEDRAAIFDILIHSQIFVESDAVCVDEMFMETWETPKVDNYRWLSCEQADGASGGPAMVGFACYGTESLTQDTWDLFWICARPEARGKGVGRALMAEVEAQARLANGRLMVIYTSSTPAFAPARRLYEAAGFARAAVIADYYRDGDDLYIYRKRLA
jgi:ribosomal protein S18 acetylase RimI-like enzyme